MSEDNKKTIKVSGKSSVQQTAGSIVISIENGCDVEVRAVGASACNQMFKALAVARGTLAARAKDLYIKPGFADSFEDGINKTVLVAKVIIQ
jgi:stage V sporulation protein SpoVS